MLPGEADAREELERVCVASGYDRERRLDMLGAADRVHERVHDKACRAVLAALHLGHEDVLYAHMKLLVVLLVRVAHKALGPLILLLLVAPHKHPAPAVFDLEPPHAPNHSAPALQPGVAEGAGRPAALRCTHLGYDLLHEAASGHGRDRHVTPLRHVGVLGLQSPLAVRLASAV